MLTVSPACNIDVCSCDHVDTVWIPCLGYVDHIHRCKHGTCDLCGGGCLLVCEMMTCAVVGAAVKKRSVVSPGTCACGYTV